MAMTIYTFPTQRVPSGTISFFVITSGGAGGTIAKTEKYFSSDVNISDATEYAGGDLQSAYCDIKIDNDEDGLFSDTILPYALGEGGYVMVKVYLNSVIMFMGTVVPSTISDEPYYILDETFSDVDRSISFRCGWAFALMRNISKELTRNEIITFASANGQWNRLTVGANSDDKLYISLTQILSLCLNTFYEVYGFSYTIQYEITDMTFYSKGDGLLNSSSYNLQGVQNPGFINYSTFYGDTSPKLVIETILSYGSDGRPSQYAPDGGFIFHESNDTFKNAYEIFTGIIKSFGLVCSITHSATVDFVVKIGTRKSGKSVVLESVITSSDIPITDVGRTGIDVTSLQTANRYKQTLLPSGGNDFTFETPFDFGNDYDFAGGANPANSYMSLVYPTRYTNKYTNLTESYFTLLRYLGIGGNKISNGMFETSLVPFTVVSGSWVHFISGITSYARADMGNTTEHSLSQSITACYDGLIFSLMVKNNTSQTVLLTMSFYQNGTLISSVIHTLNSVNITPAFNTDPMFLVATLSVDDVRRNKGRYINKVVITAKANVASGGKTLEINDIRLQTLRKGCPELVGLDIEDKFNNGILTRKQVVVNGIPTDIQPRDYFTQEGQTFYVKGINYNLSDNETEIEAINYQ